jgi:hypothetical protein
VKRSRSGQVLVAAATLMLAVLLVSAMSIPIINTDIEPSSKIYVIVREALYQNAELIITSMSAYQCALAMVYKDKTHKHADFTETAQKLHAQKIKDSILEKLKNVNIRANIRDIYVNIVKAGIDISSTPTWDSHPNSASSGSIEVTMSLNIAVTFIWNKGNPSSYSFFEQLKIKTDKKDTKVIQALPWHGNPFVELGIGFVPVIGSISENVRAVKHQISMKVTEYTVFTEEWSTGNKQGRVLDTSRLNERLYLAMLKPRKVTKTGPGLIQWEEYSHIDWFGMTVGIVIDLIPWGKLAKAGGAAITNVGQAIKPKSIDYLHTDLDPDTGNLFSPWQRRITPTGGAGGFFNDFYRKRENIRMWDEWEEVEKASKVGPRDSAALSKFAEEYLSSQKLVQGAQNLLYDQHNQNIQSNIFSSFFDWLNRFLASLLGGGGASNVYGGGIYLGPVEESIRPYQAQQKLPAYITDLDPLLYVGLPLHNGKALFSSCVWLTGAYYPK